MLGLVLIFLAKIVEVSLTTMRMLYLNKGAKIHASTIGFFEVLIWIKVASIVLVGIEENPARMFIYALGFATGSYVGILIEERIGLGYSHLEIVTNIEDSLPLISKIRETGKAITVVDGEGKDGKKQILSMYVKRKEKDKILEIAKNINLSGVITVSEIQKVYGGFGLK